MSEKPLFYFLSRFLLEADFPKIFKNNGIVEIREKIAWVVPISRAFNVAVFGPTTVYRVDLYRDSTVLFEKPISMPFSWLKWYEKLSHESDLENPIKIHHEVRKRKRSTEGTAYGSVQCSKRKSGRSIVTHEGYKCEMQLCRDSDVVFATKKEYLEHKLKFPHYLCEPCNQSFLTPKLKRIRVLLRLLLGQWTL